MNKKMIAILLSACTCLAFPAASMAAETDTESSQSISVTLTAEPEYTITIPESVSMGNDGTTWIIEISDAANNYHVVKRWSPDKDTDVYNLGTFLFELCAEHK